jgi:hypothetical protein
MIRIPLYADPVDVRSYNQLGNEFNQIQSNDRYRGLMDSDTLNPIATMSNNVDDLYAGGISNQMRIFENNSDLSDNRLYTDAQQLIRLQDIGSIDRPLTAEEKAISEAVGYDLDPNIRNTLVQEATRQGDNIYAQESQDFVKQIQQDIAEYAKEVNLYYQGVPSEDRLNTFLSGRAGLRGILGDEDLSVGDALTNDLIKALDEMDRKEKEEIRDTIIRRKKIMKERRGGKAPPKRTEEKLVTKTETISPSPSPSSRPTPRPTLSKKRTKDEL